jgi:hypothetical protein
LIPDPALLEKLADLFVSLNPIAPGGALSPDASLGTLRTGGAIELLQQSGGQLFEHELWLDIGARSASSEQEVRPSPPYAGKQGGSAS